MALSITAIRRPSAAEWDAAWEGCDYATYFHSRQWAEIWSYNHRGIVYPSPALVSFSDGARALLPFSASFSKMESDDAVKWFPESWDLMDISRRRKSLSSAYRREGGWYPARFEKCYVSSPAGTYGGWISPDALDGVHAGLLAGHIAQEYPGLTLRLNPYDKLSLEHWSQEAEHDVTYALNLTAGFEAIEGIWKPGSQSRKSRKAAANGIRITTARTLEDWHSYFLAYSDSLERWGDRATSRYGWRLFKEMHRLGSPYTKLWLARKDEEVVAGALCLYSRKHAIYWHGAALHEYFGLRPVNLLFHKIIKNACESGCSWFDFNPSGGHEGVTAFKKSFGAVPLSSPVLALRNIPSDGLMCRIGRFLKDCSRV